MSRGDLEAFMEGIGEPKYRAGQVRGMVRAFVLSSFPRADH